MDGCDENITNVDVEGFIDLNKAPERYPRKIGLTLTVRTPQSAKEKLQFPPLKCSKYTWIGHPSMQKRRK